MHIENISVTSESLLISTSLESKVDKVLIDSTDEKSTQLKRLLESLKLFEM